MVADIVESPEARTRKGSLVAALTYSLWGLLPLYWKQLKTVDSVQIICHRIIWAFVFSIIVLAATRRLGALEAVFTDRRLTLPVAAGGLLITANWGPYIWAVHAGRVVESSLGYFINPLFAVAFGAMFFGEKLDRWTVTAVSIAAAGVAVASIMMGKLPWISLVLAATFALYGAVKKGLRLDPVVGLAAETLFVAPLAFAWLVIEHRTGRGALGGPDMKVNVLLVLAGVATAAPLLMFAYAANRITLQLIGFFQYISPALQLGLSLFVFGERLTPALMVALATVVVAALIYSSTRRAAEGGT